MGLGSGGTPRLRGAGQPETRAFFGVTIRYTNAAGAGRALNIVGTDEVDLNRNHISWVSPLGRGLMKSAAGDSVVINAPGGTEYLTLLEVPVRANLARAWSTLDRHG